MKKRKKQCFKCKSIGYSFHRNHVVCEPEKIVIYKHKDNLKKQ